MPGRDCLHRHSRSLPAMSAFRQFQISGLPAEPFAPLFALSAEELERIGARRVVADSSHGYPCRVSLADVWRIVGLPSLVAGFVFTVALGTLARHWNGPAELIDGATGPETAGLAAISTVFVNNLPSAALYSAHAVDHSRMLLLGLNVGPNLAVTGALSALLWFRAAREVDARPSLIEFSRRGVPLSLVAMAAAIVVGMLT